MKGAAPGIVSSVRPAREFGALKDGLCATDEGE